MTSPVSSASLPGQRPKKASGSHVERISITDQKAALSAIKANLNSCVSCQPYELIGISDQKSNKPIPYFPIEAAAYFAVEEFFTRADNADPKNIEPIFAIAAMKKILKKPIPREIKQYPTSTFQKIAMTGSQRLFELPLEHGLRLKPEEARRILDYVHERTHFEMNNPTGDFDTIVRASKKKHAASSSKASSDKAGKPARPVVTNTGWLGTLETMLYDNLDRMDLRARAYEKVHEFIGKLKRKVEHTREKTAENSIVREFVKILRQRRERKIGNARKFIWALKNKMYERRDRNYTHARAFIDLLQQKREKTRSYGRLFLDNIKKKISEARQQKLLEELATQEKKDSASVSKSKSKSAKRKARQKEKKAQVAALQSAPSPNQAAPNNPAPQSAPASSSRPPEAPRSIQSLNPPSEKPAAPIEMEATQVTPPSFEERLRAALASHHLERRPLKPLENFNVEEARQFLNDRWNAAWEEANNPESGVVIYSSSPTG